MFRLITTGDPHLCIGVATPAGRNPDTFYDEQRSKLAFIKKYCVDNNIRDYAIAGDLLNYKTPSSYDTSSYNALTKELNLLTEQLNLWSISGNHDLKMSSREMKEQSVYHVFVKARLLKDVANKTEVLYQDQNYVTLSGIDFNPSKSDLLREIEELNKNLSSEHFNILMIHEHLLPTGESLPFGQHINYDDFLQFKNINLIISGHLHKGYETRQLSSVDVDGDGSEHTITFVNPWSLTRVARDHYALSDSHKPELVDIKIDEKTKEVTWEHVEIPHKSFDKAFIKETLISEEAHQLDISNFVNQINSFESSETDILNPKDKSDKVKEKIKYYTEMAEQKMRA